MKPTPIDEHRELEREARESMIAAFSSLFEIGERVECRMHSGATHAGLVEDANLAGLLVRDESGRLFFVAFAGIESAELFESEEPGDGETTEDETTETDAAAAVEGDEPVESVPSRAA